MPGDDAAGLLVAEEIDARAPENVDVVRARDPLRLLDLLEDVERVIVVDAVRSGSGARRPAPSFGSRLGRTDRLRRCAPRCRRTASGLVETIGLAAAVGELPPMVFHGVEAGALAAGSDLSDAVRAALPALIDAVLADAVR